MQKALLHQMSALSLMDAAFKWQKGSFELNWLQLRWEYIPSLFKQLYSIPIGFTTELQLKL